MDLVDILKIIKDRHLVNLINNENFDKKSFSISYK